MHMTVYRVGQAACGLPRPRWPSARPPFSDSAGSPRPSPRSVPQREVSGMCEVDVVVRLVFAASMHLDT